LLGFFHLVRFFPFAPKKNINTHTHTTNSHIAETTIKFFGLYALAPKKKRKNEKNIYGTCKKKIFFMECAKKNEKKNET
jgi:hypothetical protein